MYIFLVYLIIYDMTMDDTCTWLYIYLFNLNMSYTRSTGNTWNHGHAGCFTNFIMSPTIYAVAFAGFQFFAHVFAFHILNLTLQQLVLIYPNFFQIGRNLNMTIMYPNVATKIYMLIKIVCPGNFTMINSACNEKYRIIRVSTFAEIHIS
jgi:hypothetical protein